MRIRTQLLIAFLFLAVLPLSAIVLYSYYGSTAALRRASEKEAAALTADMNGRLASVREELGAAVERAGDIPAPVLVRVFEDDPEAARALTEKLGDAAPYLESFRFVPRPPAEGTPEAPAPPLRVDVDRIVADIAAAPLPPPARPEVQRHVAEAMALSRSTAAVAARAALEREAEVHSQKLREAQAIARQPGSAALQEELRAQAEEQRKKSERARVLFGRELTMPVSREGEVIGTINVEVSGDRIVSAVLGAAGPEEGEIPFAVDSEGQLYTVRDEHEQALEPIQDILPKTHPGGTRVHKDWVIASSRDDASGLVYGIARPIGEPLRELRQTAARNFAAGLALIGLALVGMVPISNHITRDLESLRSGAERIAHGDLQTRVPVRSGDEIGALAAAFNSMAEDLEVHQAEESQRHLMEAEYARKSHELEEARRFQLSLLPKSVPVAPPFEVAVLMRTATEVGGDYYDFRVGADGALTVAIGDATGHGARAATMVTILKSLFSASDPFSTDPSEFLGSASAAVRTMDLERMTMAFALGRFSGTRTGAQLTLSSAAMPPALIYRKASGEVEELAISGVPLGTIAMKYEQRTIDLERGDVVLLTTDGLPEQMGASGEPFGYPAVQIAFARVAGSPAQGIVERLGEAAEIWSGGKAPDDDITFVAVRVT